MAEKKNLTKIRDIAKRYDASMLDCRTIGHAWRPQSAAWLQGGGIEQILGCSRCEAKRIQYLDKQGYVTGRHYDYPEGYSIPGMGHMGADGRAVLRLASVRKMLDGNK